MFDGWKGEFYSWARRYVQSEDRNPPASPEAQRKSSGLESTRWIVFGSVLPVSERKYAVHRPIIPAPRITVLRSEIPLELMLKSRRGATRGIQGPGHEPHDVAHPYSCHLIERAPNTCRLDWPLLQAVGRDEGERDKMSYEWVTPPMSEHGKACQASSGCSKREPISFDSRIS